jgi:hypothetical protein
LRIEKGLVEGFYNIHKQREAVLRNCIFKAIFDLMLDIVPESLGPVSSRNKTNTQQKRELSSFERMLLQLLASCGLIISSTLSGSSESLSSATTRESGIVSSTLR